MTFLWVFLFAGVPVLVVWTLVFSAMNHAILPHKEAWVPVEGPWDEEERTQRKRLNALYEMEENLLRAA